MAEERCIMCGSVIPEGRMVCPLCEAKADKAYHFVIYAEPRSKKNSQQIAFNPQTKRPFVTQSKAYKDFSKEVIKQIRMNGFAPKEPINYPINIKYVFFKSTKRLCDGLNLSAAMDDILTVAQVIGDDHRDIVAGHDGTRVFYDRENPRVEVTITPLVNYERWKE